MKYANTDMEIRVGDLVEAGSHAAKIVVGILRGAVILRFQHDPDPECDHRASVEDVRFVFRGGERRQAQAAA